MKYLEGAPEQAERRAMEQAERPATEQATGDGANDRRPSRGTSDVTDRRSSIRSSERSPMPKSRRDVLWTGA